MQGIEREEELHKRETEMHEKFGAPVGLSDHSGSIFPSIAAMAIGASVLEVHITPSEYMFGPDIKSSISLQDLKLIVDARDAFIKIFNSVCRSFVFVI